MKTYSFAINTRREYYDIAAASEEDARQMLEASIDSGSRVYYSGQSLDLQELELIDVEG